MHCLQQALQQGELLLWNADLFSGYFMLGAAQSLTYYPVYWLLYSALPLLSAYKLSEAFHLWLLARGIFGAARELGGSRQASLLAAGAAALCGSVAAHHQHVHIVNGLGWTGPILWSAVRLVTSRRPALPGLLLAACFGLALLSSHPQYVFYAGLASLTLLFGIPRSDRLRGLGRIAAAGLASAPLAAALLLPVREYASVYPRPLVGGPLEFLTGGGLRPIDAPGWLLGEALPGQPEVVCFGAAFLVLAIAGAWRVRCSRVARVGLALVLLGALLSPAYHYQPLHRLLIHVPPFSFLRRPARLGWFLQLGAALLAAGAVDGLRRGSLSPPARRLPPALVGAGLAASLVAAHWTGHELRGLSVGVAFLGVAVTGLALRRPAWLPLALACGLLELGVLWLAHAPTRPDAEVLQPPPLARIVAATENRRLLDIGQPEEQTLASARRLKRNGGLRWGISYVSGFEPLPPVPQELLYLELLRALEVDPNGRFALLCDRHSIRWILTSASLLEDPALRLRGETDGASLYENLNARPVAYALSDRLEPVDVREEAALRWVLDVRDGPGPRRVVLSQSWYPGWEASVDGAPAPVELVEGIYMGVDVGPGPHRVELSFDNQQVFFGQRVGLAAWIAWLGALLLLGLRRLGAGRDP